MLYLRNSVSKRVLKIVDYFIPRKGHTWKCTPCSVLVLARIGKSLCLWSISFLAAILKPHQSSLSLEQRKAIFLSAQEKNNRLRMFECSAFLQQLSCIDLGSSLGNTWDRSDVSCCVSVFQNNNINDCHLFTSCPFMT